MFWRTYGSFQRVLLLVTCMEQFSGCLTARQSRYIQVDSGLRMQAPSFGQVLACLHWNEEAWESIDRIFCVVRFRKEPL